MTTTPTQTDLVNLVIDGIDIAVPKGTLIIRAAEQAGIQIPRFCDHPGLDPVGACRQCLVEVWMPGPPAPDGTPGEARQMQGPPGRMKPQASCTMTVAPGMIVKTQYSSEAIDKAQQGVMELLLINHPLDCPVCDKGGECPLQNQAMSSGHDSSRFEDVKRTYAKPINISPLVLLDRERCVLCARCTRFSEQVSGDPFIALVERGALQQVGIYEEHPYESYFSGNVIQICPVGALTSASYRFRSRPFDLVSTPTSCEHCASGCAIRADHRRGTVLRRLASPDPMVNDEWLCDKGRFAFAYPQVGDRIEFPMIRQDGELRVASWPEALAAAAAGLSAAANPAVLTGGRMTVEDAYAYAKFARMVLHTNDIDFRARPHSVEEADFLAARVAASSPETGAVTYADLAAAPHVLLVALEPEEESPGIFLKLRHAARKAGTAISAVAPMSTRGLVKLSGSLIPAAPGTEPEILSALAQGSDRATEAIRAAAEGLRQPGAVVLVGERLATVPGGLSAAAALADATGAKLAWVPRRAGERGAIEAGALPGLLPGGRLVSDAAARAEVAAAWQAGELPTAAGRSTAEILTAAAAGVVDALVIGGVEAADIGLATDAALERAFVVSLEIRHSEVTAHADVVLPVAPAAEKNGHFLDWEGRVRPVSAALNTSALSDYRVLEMLAAELGHFLGARTHDEVAREFSALGTTSAARPPAPEVEAVTPPQLGDGQAVLATWATLLDDGRLQDGQPYLARTAPASVAMLSAATAEASGLVEGDTVVVSSGAGSIALPVTIAPDLTDYVVWLPTNSPGSHVRSTLRVGSSAVVAIAKEGAV